MSDLHITGTHPTGVTLTANTYSTVTIDSGASLSGDAAFLTQYSVAVENQGTIIGNSVGASLYGGSLTNAVGGSISASLTAVYGQAAGGPVTIDNAGTISGNNGVNLLGGGALTNESTGWIFGTNDGAYTDGLIVNAGTISGGDGVLLGSTGSLINEASGTISGNVSGVYSGVPGSDVTIENAGTIIGLMGADAIDFRHAGTHRLIIDAGATFIGNVVATAGTNTIELSATGGAGTISGLGAIGDPGAKYSGFQTITIDAGATWSIAGTIAGFEQTTIQGFGDADKLDLTNLTFNAADTVTFDNGTDILTIHDIGGNYTIQLAGDLSHEQFQLGSDTNGDTFVTGTYVPCFCRGTLILTPDGEVAVEDLKVGDLVTTIDGGAKPIRWVGMGRSLVTATNTAARPVVVRKGALSDGVPSRDLRVTKAHALYLDGVLIPVEYLINGKSIVWDEQAQVVEFYHIELPAHDVLFADGAPAESYKDEGNRDGFLNYDYQPPIETEWFAPVKVGGSEVLDVWRAINRRAGFARPALNRDPDLHLRADGARIDAERVEGLRYRFRLDAPPTELRLVSRSVVPREIGHNHDERRLGVAVGSLTLRNAHATKKITFDSHLLRTEGFHEAEMMNKLRWTDGNAVLPCALLFDARGPIEVILEIVGIIDYPIEAASSVAA